MNKFIFDVDGTLTPSRGTIDSEFKEWFLEFCDNNLVYLVTGSDRPKTVEQIGEDVYNRCSRVYQCSGNEVWIQDDRVKTSNWTLPADAHEWLTTQLTECDFNIRTGLHFEHRTGMVNFSIVGRNANAEQRQAWLDYEAWNGDRRRIADDFNKLFPSITATVGGETGIDIAPTGADKSQILKDFDDDDYIVFFGDAMFEGGNDYPLALANYNGTNYCVKGWEETWEKLLEHSNNRT